MTPEIKQMLKRVAYISIASVIVGYCISFLLVACGADTQPDPVPVPVPTQTVSWDEVKATVQGNCGNCHNGIVRPENFNIEAQFKASKAKAKLTAGAMPPSPRTLNVDDKSLLLAYLSQ